jgi:hypothetical protein
MIIKTKKVYYCDFCGKRSLAKWSLEKHETHCTGNPNRQCRLCGRKEPLSELIKKWLAIREKWMAQSIISDWGNVDFLTAVREEMEKEINVANVQEDINDCCPACTLAIVRQAKLAYHPISINYDYKKEIEEWWNCRRHDYE